MIFRKLRQVLCLHAWSKSYLILSGGRNTHYDKKQCCKCRKSVTVFSGTRKEWYEHHGWEYIDAETRCPKEQQK